MTLLDAITRAGGMSDNAGPENLITHQPSGAGSVGLTESIRAKSLQDPAGTSANLVLQGGDIVRVPDAGQIFMVGNVNHPGPFSITNNADMSMMKALSIAGGLSAFASHTAYIYRADSNDSHKSEIPVKLSKILARKSPDVPLYANDMVYVPNRSVAQATLKTFEVAGPQLASPPSWSTHSNSFSEEVPWLNKRDYLRLSPLTRPTTSRQRFITRLWRRPPKSKWRRRACRCRIMSGYFAASLENAGICSH